MESDKKRESITENNVSRELFLDMDSDDVLPEQMMHIDQEKLEDEDEEPIDNSQD